MGGAMDWDKASRLDRSSLATLAPAEIERAWHHPEARLLPVLTRGALAFTRPGVIGFVRPTGAWDPATDLVLARIENAPVFARMLADEADVRGLFPAGQAVTVSDLRSVLDEVDDDLDLAFMATALARWHDQAQFCPRCGQRSDIARGGTARWCRACQQESFPRVDPAIIVSVTGPGDRLLLGHHQGWARARHSVFAGYVEPGESAEQAVHREIAEEVDLHDLFDLTYVGSRPWPFPRSLMLAFAARTNTRRFSVDGSEIEQARWFTRDELSRALASGEVGLPSRHSSAMVLIERWWKRTKSSAVSWEKNPPGQGATPPVTGSLTA